MFSLIFGFAFGFFVGIILMAFAMLQKLHTHDCIYDGTVKWVERAKPITNEQFEEKQNAL